MKIMAVIVLSMSILSAHGQNIRGKINDSSIEKIYLYEVINEYRSTYKPIDSTEVIDGNFIFSLKNLPIALYYIGDKQRKGGYVFWDNNEINLHFENTSDKQKKWSVQGSELHEKYNEFLNKIYEETYGLIKDSLDNLFYQARAVRDTANMARIKKESLPYYEKGTIKEKELINEYIEKNLDNDFGLYLYYYRIFQRKDFPALDDIINERTFVDRFKVSEENNYYLSKINQGFEQYKNCALGAFAPEIIGLDTLGNIFKLSDLRGNYVLVDYWNSYCHWCRKETPALQDALDYFKDKNFKILGVSSDIYKDKWMDAIHEDESYWNHIILEKGNTTMNEYCIKGIPHIILIDPNGRILAKELRGKDLINVSKEYIK